MLKNVKMAAAAILLGAMFVPESVAAQQSAAFPRPLAGVPHTTAARKPVARRSGFTYLKTGKVRKPFANPRGIYADLLVEQAQPYTVSYSFPAGTFDASCGTLAWTVTGGPSNATLTMSPATTSLTGSSTLQIATSTQTPFGVTTSQIAAKCQKTPTTGASAGGLSPTIGIYEYPPDPTAVASQQGMTIVAGTTGYFSLYDTAGAQFGPLTWQAWGAPGTLTFSSATTTGSPHSNTLAVAIPASTAVTNYAFSADVYSTTSFGESSPVTLYINVVAPTSSNVAPLFQNIYSMLKSGTSAPIVLPALVSPLAFNPIYASLDYVTSQAYIIDFSDEQGCNGAGRCNQGYLNSSPAVGSPDLTILHSGYSTITLTNGDKAHIGHGQYREPTTITWDDHGRRYVLAETVNNFPSDLIAMANSMTTY